VVLSFVAAHRLLGIWGVIPNVVLFPLTSWLAPFYFGFADGDWRPTVIVYGGLFVGVLLWNILLSSDIRKPG